MRLLLRLSVALQLATSLSGPGTTGGASSTLATASQTVFSMRVTIDMAAQKSDDDSARPMAEGNMRAPSARRAAAAPGGHIHLGWWTESPASFGCRGDGMPLPSSTGQCWNNTLALIAEHRGVIDRLQVISGMQVTASSAGLLANVTVHSDNVTKTYPLALLPRWVPALKAALLGRLGKRLDSGEKRLDSLLLLESTAAAHAACAVVDALAAQLVDLTSTYDFTGINVDYEAQCCETPDRATGLCPCDAAEAQALAKFVGSLSAALGAVGKTVTLCVNEGGAGFLRMPYLQKYLEIGKVERLMQMGTYGVGHWPSRAEGEGHRDNLTRVLLDNYPPERIGLGVATTLHYKQNVSSLTDWFATLQPYAAAASQRAPLELDLYYLQGGDPDPVAGGGYSPPADWWPLLTQLRRHPSAANGIGALNSQHLLSQQGDDSGGQNLVLLTKNDDDDNNKTNRKNNREETAHSLPRTSCSAVDMAQGICVPEQAWCPCKGSHPDGRSLCESLRPQPGPRKEVIAYPGVWGLYGQFGSDWRQWDWTKITTVALYINLGSIEQGCQTNEQGHCDSPGPCCVDAELMCTAHAHGARVITWFSSIGACHSDNLNKSGTTCQPLRNPIVEWPTQLRVAPTDPNTTDLVRVQEWANLSARFIVDNGFDGVLLDIEGVMNHGQNFRDAITSGFRMMREQLTAVLPGSILTFTAAATPFFTGFYGVTPDPYGALDLPAIDKLIDFWQPGMYCTCSGMPFSNETMEYPPGVISRGQNPIQGLENMLSVWGKHGIPPSRLSILFPWFNCDFLCEDDECTRTVNGPKLNLDPREVFLGANPCGLPAAAFDPAASTVGPDAGPGYNQVLELLKRKVSNISHDLHSQTKSFRWMDNASRIHEVTYDDPETLAAKYVS